MSLNREQTVFLQHVAELIAKAPEYGLMVTAGELYRTPEQQSLHVKSGRSKTMNSQHLKRLAIDLNFFREAPDGTLQLVYDGDDVRRLGAFWESLDPGANRWGGNWSSFKDTPHFERRENSGSPLLKSVTVAASPQASARGAKLLAGTVGVRCQNIPHDVESVQRLLNLNAQRFHLDEPLQCDGKVGKKTISACRGFQKSVLGMADTDGTIRPGDATLTALCTVLPHTFNDVLLSFIYLNADDADVTALAAFLNDAMGKYEINTPLRQAHFLAQVGHESGELRYREEIASGNAYENRRELGNLRPGDGPRFKGRGLIQLTGRANYVEYCRPRGLDVDNDADTCRIATDEHLCVDVAGWFWDRHGLNTFADRDDIETITRRINGGLNGLDNRRRLLSRGKTLLNA